VDREIQALAGLDQGLGQLPVRGGGGEAAAGVVVHQDQPHGLVFQSRFQDLAGVGQFPVQCAFLDDLFGNDFIPAVQLW